MSLVFEVGSVFLVLEVGMEVGRGFLGFRGFRKLEKVLDDLEVV